MERTPENKTIYHSDPRVNSCKRNEDFALKTWFLWLMVFLLLSPPVIFDGFNTNLVYRLVRESTVLTWPLRKLRYLKGYKTPFSRRMRPRPCVISLPWRASFAIAPNQQRLNELNVCGKSELFAMRSSTSVLTHVSVLFTIHHGITSNVSRTFWRDLGKFLGNLCQNSRKLGLKFGFPFLCRFLVTSHPNNPALN